MTQAIPTMDLSSASASAVAFEQARPDILEAAKAETVTLNVDPTTVVRAILTGLGNAKPHMESVALLPFTNHALIAKLHTYALAFGYAHALHSWTLEGPKATEALVEQLRLARRQLVAELELVIVRGVLPKGAVTIQMGTSYHSMVEDVRAIATALLANWTKVGPQIGNSPVHIEEALESADRLMAALAESDQIQEKVKGTQLTRAAAWTLAYRAHQELERAIAYLRFHEDDAEYIVPSLFLRPKSRKPGDKEPKKDEPQVLSPVAPIATQPGATLPAVGGNLPSAPVTPTQKFE